MLLQVLRPSFLIGILILVALSPDRSRADSSASPSGSTSTSTSPATTKKKEFPLDLPSVTKCHGADCNVNEYEFDTYLGASYASNGGDGGLGFTGRIEKDNFWKGGMGSMATCLVDGGVYGLGAGDGASVVMDVSPEWDVGYYDEEAAVSGWGWHVMLTPINGGATFAGSTGTLYSYTPALDIGIHGRDAKRKSPWQVSLEIGESIGYGTGVYRKLNSGSGTFESSVTDPYLYLAFTTDQKIGARYLRIHLAGSDRIDSIGSQGVRHILDIRGYTWLKISEHFYTGPAATYNFAGKQADLTTMSYVAAPSVITGTWDAGYTW